MTSDEIQAAIAGLLAVQKELQASQISSRQEAIEMTESIKEHSKQIQEHSKQIQELKENGERIDRRLTLLIGHSFEREEDYLNILERIIRVERRILEQNQ